MFAVEKACNNMCAYRATCVAVVSMMECIQIQTLQSNSRHLYFVHFLKLFTLSLHKSENLVIHGYHVML